jgi:hypothetical protein
MGGVYGELTNLGEGDAWREKVVQMAIGAQNPCLLVSYLVHMGGESYYGAIVPWL